MSEKLDRVRFILQSEDSDEVKISKILDVLTP